MSHARPVLPLWAALGIAAASGPILAAGFPDKDLWPLTFLGVALVLVALIGRRAGSALLVGFVAGCAFYFTLIQWAALFLGPLPMSALAVLESLFFAAGALTITLAYRWIPRVWPGTWGRLGMLPVAIAGLWTAREAWASVWPYGGFSWGRVAFSQADTPFSQLFSWLGVSGVSFAVVLVCAVAIEASRLIVRGRSRMNRPIVRARNSAALRLAVVPIALVGVLAALPAFPVPTPSTLRVAAVQGNGKAGYFDERQYGDLLQAQLKATAPLFGQKVDLVVWPEGSTDASPYTDAYTAAAFDLVSTQLHAPLVTWAVTDRGAKTYNTSLLWKAGQGVVDYYDKRHPVPFGEYIPDRAFWRPFAPSLIDLVGREYTPGTTDMVFNINGVIAGINICFDIVDDQLLTESVEQGAQIILASSNNADFGRTNESAQQLAIARIRALELGRSVVNISTVGLSAVITPDGRIAAELPWFEPGAMVEDVPLATVITPAVSMGRQIEWFVSGLGLALLAIAGASAAGGARRRDHAATPRTGASARDRTER
jgi:apolipoprotein N-acyltransferase